MAIKPTRVVKQFVSLLLVLALSACSSLGTTPDTDPLVASELLIENASEYAGNQSYIRLLHKSRTWAPAKSLSGDPIEFGKQASIPIQHVGAKILGPSHEDAMRSLALKIWMIEQAEYTLDVVYYIFKQDLVGNH